MSFSGKVAIAGVYEHPTRWAPDKSESQIMAESARGALADCGLTRDDVDGLFSAGISMGPMGLVGLAEYLDLKPRYLDGTNIGGSSFVAHVSHAAAAIHAKWRSFSTAVPRRRMPWRSGRGSAVDAIRSPRLFHPTG